MSDVTIMGLIVLLVLIGVAAAASVIMDASQPMGRHEFGAPEYELSDTRTEAPQRAPTQGEKPEPPLIPAVSPIARHPNT